MGLRNRHWPYGGGSITMGSTYTNGWDTFIEASHIEDTETHRLLFDTLFILYNGRFTRHETRDYLTNQLTFLIKEYGVKYDKLKIVYDDTDNGFIRELEIVKQFSTGNRLDDIENFDKFLSGKLETEKRQNVLERYKEFSKTLNPLSDIIQQMTGKIFIPVIAVTRNRNRRN